MEGLACDASGMEGPACDAGGMEGLHVMLDLRNSQGPRLGEWCLHVMLVE